MGGKGALEGGLKGPGARERQNGRQDEVGYVGCEESPGVSSSALLSWVTWRPAPLCTSVSPSIQSSSYSNRWLWEGPMSEGTQMCVEQGATEPLVSAQSLPSPVALALALA